MTRSCVAAIHAESLIRRFLEKEARTSMQRVGVRPAPLKVGEESMAEIMLLDLADHFSDVVDVVMFSRHIEARQTGADWLWCIDTPTGEHFMLVQAKRPDEAMSQRGTSWTINIPRRKNKHSRKNQHQTLCDAAVTLGVTPCYCLFFPARPTSGCSQVAEYVEDWDWQVGWPNPRDAWRGYIHIVKAQALSEGRNRIDRWKPPGITLTSLLCCEYGGSSMQGREFDDGYWDMSSASLTWDNLVARLSDSLVHTPTRGGLALSSIVGAIRVTVQGAQ